MDVNISQLRTRQTELVQALAEESSSAKLGELSTELEEITRQLEASVSSEQTEYGTA